jgi:glycolate oxidase
VALPTETAEVATLVRLASEHRVPIVPRGAGSGLSGGAAGIEDGLTNAFTAMNKIVEIDRENLVAVVQPGIINAALKSAVAEQGLFYPPDPASFEMCSIGGNLGTNAGGLCCVKYGQTRDSVLSLEVVMADGAVIRTGGKNVKDVAGYSLTHLFVGSQGTLAIITEATMKLRPAPPPRSTMLAFFPTLMVPATRSRDRHGRALAGDPELLDRFTINAVDEMNDPGSTDRGGDAMIGPMPQRRAGRAGGRKSAGGRRDRCRACGGCPGGDWLRQRRAAHYALERLGEVRLEDERAALTVPDSSARSSDAERHHVRIDVGHA